MDSIRKNLVQILDDARKLSTATQDEIDMWRRKAQWALVDVVTPELPVGVDIQVDPEILGLYIATMQAVRNTGCPLHIADVLSKNGFGEYEPRGAIWLWSGLNYTGRVKVAIHEIAHWYMHGFYGKFFTSMPPRLYKEQAAEAVTYAVCRELELDCYQYSVSYIAHQIKSASRYLLRIDGLIDAASVIVTSIKTNMEAQTNE